MSFYNKEQSNSMSHYHELRDTAASCFVNEFINYFTKIKMI